MIASRILGTVNPLVLQCREERLRHRVIVAYPGAANGLAEVMLLQRRRELAGWVIAAAVGVKDSILAEPVIACGHLDSLLDERGLVVIVHGPADHCFRLAGDSRRQLQPCLPWRTVGDIP